MGITRIEKTIDSGTPEVLDLKFDIAGLAPGPHELKIEMFDGVTSKGSQIRNITVGAVDIIDPDYQAVLDYASANSIPLPDTNQQAIDNQLLIDYKATGAWEKDDVLFKFKGNADPEFKLIDWKRLIQAVAYGSLTWSADGVKGNGTNAYIDTLYNPSTLQGNYVQNSASIGFRTFDIGTAGTRTLTGYYSGTDTAYTLVIPNNGVDQSYANINGRISGALQFDPYASTAYTQLDRDTAGSKINVTGEAKTYASTGVSGNFYIFSRNNVGTPDVWGDQGISFIRYGANSEAEYSAIKTVIDSI